MAYKLYQFHISHFCEKARWALDYKGVPYSCVNLVPGTHMLVTKRLASKSSVPILATGKNNIQGSDLIINYLERTYPSNTLLPTDETARRQVLELQQYIDEEVGVVLRAILYAILLPYPKQLKAFWCEQAPAWNRLIIPFVYPMVARKVARVYKVKPGEMQQEEARFFRALDKLDELCSSPFLVGDQFSLADLTLASLLAHLVQPNQHPMRWPENPGEMQLLRNKVINRPSAQRVLALYADYRQSHLNHARIGLG